jgi:osmotically-inducible protein OsmY
MTQTRPAVDILDDIYNLIAHYPPLQADRHHIHIDVNDGVVNLSGHVRSAITEGYLVDRVKQVPGVRVVVADQLFNEEEIRLETGRRIPPGVIANVYYGAAVLTGKLPPDVTPESVVEGVAHIPGVEQVVTHF